MSETQQRPNPGMPLAEHAHEVYAQHRALGETARAAAELAGLPRGVYTQVEASDEFRARVRHLREQKAAPPKLSLDWLAAELTKNVQGARDAEQFKASTEALKLIFDLYKENRDHFDRQEREVPESETADERRTTLRNRLTVVAPVKASEGA